MSAGYLRSYKFQRQVFRLRNYWHRFLSNLRVAKLRLLGAKLGTGVTIGNLSCNWPAQLQIGDCTSLLDGVVADFCWGTPQPGPSIVIGEDCYIGRGVEFNIRQRIEIGRDCLVAAGVRFVDHDHGIETGLPMRLQEGSEDAIIVGADVWIGANAIILKGVAVGDGAVIASGAVVTKSIPAFEIWGGVPARFISTRKEKKEK